MSANRMRQWEREQRLAAEYARTERIVEALAIDAYLDALDGFDPEPLSEAEESYIEMLTDFGGEG